MEKNGNTLAPGMRVRFWPSGEKTASDVQYGTVKDVDVDTQLVRVKLANGIDRQVPFGSVEADE